MIPIGRPISFMKHNKSFGGSIGLLHASIYDAVTKLFYEQYNP
jgi:hypothetical protein